MNSTWWWCVPFLLLVMVSSLVLKNWPHEWFSWISIVYPGHLALRSISFIEWRSNYRFRTPWVRK